MFVRNVRSSCSRSMSSMLSCGCCSAALLTRMSIRPNSFSVRATASRQKLSYPMSPAIVMQRRPSASTSRFVSFASSCSLRYRHATSAPSLAKTIATARPIPLSPPVISATLPSSFPHALYFGSLALGRGRIFDSSPGRRDCCCAGRSGFGSFSFFAIVMLLGCFARYTAARKCCALRRARVSPNNSPTMAKVLTKVHGRNGRAATKTSERGGRGYPRPQLVRKNWTELNGTWEFTTDPDGRLTSPDGVQFGKRITVPFTCETPMSGVGDTGFFHAVWYRRTFDTPRLTRDQRLILHFGAVDYRAQVWVNGQLCTTHEGGYTPFSADVTDLLQTRGPQTIVVRAEDDPQDLSKPRGKQDWKLDPHSIWYPRTTGIWQTVWMEVVPRTRLASLRWTPNVRKWEITLQARVEGPDRDGMRLAVTLRKGDRVLTQDVYQVSRGEVVRTIALTDPGIDDARNDLLWWPWAPNLIDAELRLLDENDREVDVVASYTAMRSVSIIGDRFVMNSRPLYLRLVLDQGYWAESGLTAPSDDALRRDVELVKEMGFNGVRKHQKIEDPRFLYWADRLGLLVWEEMPSAYTFDDLTVRRLSHEWSQAIERDVSHPCVIAWVPLNESWGVPDLPHSRQQRDFVRAMYSLTKSLDATRPVIGNDGWENIITDIIAIHDYDGDPQRIAKRYERSSDNLFKLFEHERPGHKVLLLDEMKYDGQPVMLTEFGGIAFHKDTKGTWGYRRAASAQEFQRQYTDLLAVVKTAPLFSGFCYTQLTDTYQEANGLLYMDRTPKFPIEDIKKATE